MERDTYPRKWGLGPKVDLNFYPFELPDELFLVSRPLTVDKCSPSYPFSGWNCDKDVNSVDYSKFVNKSCTKFRSLEMYVSLASYIPHVLFFGINLYLLTELLKMLTSLNSGTFLQGFMDQDNFAVLIIHT